MDTALPARDVEEATRPETSGGGAVSALGWANPVPLAVALGKATTIYRDVAHRDDAAFIQILRQDLTDPETGEPVLASLMEDLEDLQTLVAAHPRRALSASEQTAYRMLHNVAGAIVGKAIGSVQGLLRDEGRLIRARNALLPSVLMAPPYIAPVLQNPQALNFVSLIAGTHTKAALTMGGLARHATYSARLMSETSFDLVLPLNVPGFVNLGPIMDRSLLTGENPRLSVSEWAAISGSLQGLVFFAAGFADYLPRLADSVLSLAIGAGLPMPETERIALAKGRLRLLSESDSSRAADAGAVESQPVYLTQEALTRRISSLRTRFTMIERAQHLFEERGAHVSESTERQISLIGKDILQLERLAAQLVDLPPAPGLGNVDFWPKFGYALATATVRGGGIAASVLARNPLAMSTVVPASTYLIVRTVTEMLDPNVTAADAAKQFIHFTPPALVAILPGVVNALSGGETFRSIDNAYPWLLYTLGMSATYADRLGEGVAWLSSSAVGAGQRYLPRALAAVTSWRNSSTPTGQIAPAETNSSNEGEESPEAMGAVGVPGGFTPDLRHPAPPRSSADDAADGTTVRDESRGAPSQDVASKGVDDLDEEWGAVGVPGGFSLSSATDTSGVAETPEATKNLGALNTHLASQGKPRSALRKGSSHTRTERPAPWSHRRSDAAPVAPSLARPSSLGPQPWSALDSNPKQANDAAVQNDPIRTAPTDDAPVVPRRNRRVRFDVPSDNEDSGDRPPVKEPRTKVRPVASRSNTDADAGDQRQEGKTTKPVPRRAPGSGDSFLTMPEERVDHLMARDIPRFEPDREVDGSTRALSRQALRKRVSPTDTPFVGPDRLVDANLIRPPRGDAARSTATARLNARWWQALSQGERRAMITAYPEQVGSAEGLPPRVRDEANRQALADARAREGANPSRLPAFITRLDAVHSALRQAGHRSQASDGGRPMVLSFEPEAYSRDGRILVAVGGDPYRASSVSWIVPGMTTTMASLRDLLDDAMNLVDSARAEGAPDPVVIVWIGYDAPSGWRSVRVTGRALAEAGGEVLHADIRAFNAGRDPNAPEGSRFSNNHVFAHSYGSTTTSFAGRDGRLAGQVRTITLLGSPGAGPQRTAADFGIGTNVFVASSSRDPVTALGRTPDPNAMIGQGIDPALQQFGARRLASEFPRSMDEMSTVMTHTSYYRYVDTMGSRSQSLTNFGRIVAGRHDGLDGDDHRVTGRPLLGIGRTHEPAIEPSAGRRWWGLNWGAPATTPDANTTGSESDSDNGTLDMDASIELRFREKAKTLDDRELRTVHARATQIALQATQRYQANPASTRLVVYVDVGGNGRRWPFQGWPYNGRPTTVGERRAAEIHRVLEEEVHRQLRDGGVPTSQVTFRAESRGRGIPDTAGRPHDFGSDETARRVVVIRTEEEAPVTDGEVHVDFAERSTHLGSVQRDELVQFLDHVVNEAVRRSAANQGAVVVRADGGGNGGNLLHKADTVGMERARATLEYLEAAVRARLEEHGIHASMVRFAEPTSRGSTLPGGASANGNRPTDAPATRRVTVRLEEVPATHHDVDSSPSPRPDDPPPLSDHWEPAEAIALTPPTLPPYGDDESVDEGGRGHEPRASTSQGRSSLGRSPVDGGFFLAVSTSRGPDESWLDLESNSDPE
ncbi:MAG: alpha/beta hydrolase [Mycobacterium sp.]